MLCHAQLDLRFNGIGAKGAKALGEALKLNGSLTSLDVGSNKIRKKAALELVKIFSEKQMTSVGLAECDLGAEGAKAVAEYVQLSSSLTSLDLSSNRLCGVNVFGEGTYTAEAINAIGEALKINGSLKEVRSASAHTRPSDLTACCVSRS